MTKKPLEKQWECTIFISDDEFPLGADLPPRQAAIKAIEDMGLTVTACASSWGGEICYPKAAGLKRRIAELEADCKDLQECFDECYEELRLNRDELDSKQSL